MPIYEYFCEKCGTVVELIISNDKTQYCSKCGLEMQKLISRSYFKVIGDSAANNYGAMSDKNYISKVESDVGNVNTEM